MVNGEAIPKGVQFAISLRGKYGKTDLPTAVTVTDRIFVAVNGSDVSIGIDEKPAAESNFDGDYVDLEITDGLFFIYSEPIGFYSR